MALFGKKIPKRVRLIAEWQGAIPVMRELFAGDGPAEFGPLARAFRELGLDPTKHIDWQILAALLASFSPAFRKSQPKTPREWGELRYLELLWQVHKRRRNDPSLRFGQACEQIAQDRKSPKLFQAGKRTWIQRKGLLLEKQLQKAQRHYERNQQVRAIFPLAFK